MSIVLLFLLISAFTSISCNSESFLNAFATASVNASNTIFSGTFLSSSTPRIAFRSCVYLISMISPYNLIANLAKRILFFSIVAVRFTALSRYSNVIVSALTVRTYPYNSTIFLNGSLSSM